MTGGRLTCLTAGHFLTPVETQYLWSRPARLRAKMIEITAILPPQLLPGGHQ